MGGEVKRHRNGASLDAQHLSRLLLIGALLCLPARAADIVIISDRDIGPYRLTIEGFKREVNAPVHDYLLREAEHYLAGETPDLIFALGANALRLSRRQAAPVVYAYVLQPGDFPAPRREAGIAMSAPAEDLFTALLSVAPGIKCIGVAFDPSQSRDLIQEGKAAARKLGLELDYHPARTSEEAIHALESMAGSIDAVWMIPDTTTVTPAIFRHLLRLTFVQRLPLLSFSEQYVRAGALISLSFDSSAVGRQAGEIAKRILAGKRTDPYLAMPKELFLAINRETAETIGLSIPPSVLKKTDRFYPEAWP